MSIALRTKYLSIKKEKLSETGKTVLKSMYDATDGFKDAKATRKIKPKFEAFYDKLKKSKPEAIKGATKPKETPTAKQFKEARERRKSQTGVPKKESDIKKDADRPAIDRKGKRVTDGTHYPYKKGNVYYEYRDNRYDKRPAKYPKLEDGGEMLDNLHGIKTILNLGKIDYDGRGRKVNAVEIEIELKKVENKTDWQTLKKVDGYALSISAGVWNSRHTDYIVVGQMLDELRKFYRSDKDVLKIISIWKKYANNDMQSGTEKQTESVDKWLAEGHRYDYSEASEYLKSIGLYEDNGYKYGYGWLFQPIPQIVIEELKEAIEHIKTKKYEDGGHVQGYDDREDERLSMEHGKMSMKDLHSTHARRDDARFEERMADGGMMAKGGELKSHKVAMYKNDKGGVTYIPLEGKERMYNKAQVKQLIKDVYGKTIQGSVSFEDTKEWDDEMYKQVTGKKEHGGMMALGGMTPGRWYKDNQGNEFKYIGEDMSGRSLFNDGERTMHKTLDDFEPNVKETKMFGWFGDGGEMLNGGEEHRSDGGDQLFADGGKVDNGNVEMVMSNTKAIEHHAQELKKLVDMNTPIEAWVVAKLERAETDLSDVTHYIDGLKSKFADGGELEGHEVEIFFNTKDKVADPYTVIVDGSVYSMSGTTGPYSVNLYVGEIDEFSPQAVKGWGKKINFVNAEPELISQIESRFEDEMANGGYMANGGSIQDIEEYVANEYFNGRTTGFSISKNNAGKYEINIDNIEEFEADYGDYVEETKKIEDDINSKYAKGGMMADGGELDKYIEVNGTFYQKGTPQAVINALESARNNRTRVKIFYGDPETGRDWHEELDTTGTIGRSTGSIKIPLLISTSRSSGGGAILTKNIVKIRDTQSGRVLYQNENYKQPNIEIVESTTDGYTHDVLIDGELYSRHKTKRSAELLKSKMMADGGMMAKGGETDYSKQTSDDFKLGEIVWDVDNKRYGTIIGIYDQYASDKFEVRLDTDGMQPTENLRKVGSKGDKGTKEKLNEEIKLYASLLKKYPQNNYPKQIDPNLSARVGSIPNNYEGKTAEEVWGAWTLEQKNNFLEDHKDEIKRVSGDNSWHKSSARTKSFNELPQYVKDSVIDHVFTGQYANGGYLAQKTSVEVGNEKISVIKRRKEKTGYPVYINSQGYAPMTLDVYPTKELATKKAKALANKEGYSFSNWEKVGEFKLEPYAKGGAIKGGKFNVGDKVMIDDSGFVTAFDGFDLSKPATITNKNKVKTSRGIVYTYNVQFEDGKKPFNSALENKLSLVESKMAKGGRLSRKQKQLDLNKNGKLDSQDFKMLRAKRKNARKK